jgi:hypothetical protein
MQLFSGVDWKEQRNRIAQAQDEFQAHSKAPNQIRAAN